MKQFIRLINLIVALIFAGCHSFRGPETDLSPIAVEDIGQHTEVILLPQEEGYVGKVIVRDHGKIVILDKAWQKVNSNNLGNIEIATKENVESNYAPLLFEMPKKPRNYIIYIQYDSTDIASDTNILARIIEDIKSNSALEVDVIGYCDRAGTDEYNKVLSMKRANEIANSLIEAGVDKSIIVLDYYGEENPIVHTEDGVANELNRRVEVTLK